MANSKITALTELTSVAGGDLVAIVDDPSGTPTSKKITKANLVKNIAVSDLANGTDGELITWNSSGVASAVPVGTATNVLTSNGAGQAPTFQAAGGSGNTFARIVKKADETITNDSTLSDDAELTVALTAGKTYSFICTIWYDSNSNPDFKMSFPLNGNTGRRSTGTITSTANMDTTSLETTSNWAQNDAADYAAVNVGYVVSAGGALTLQWAQNTSSGTATTVKEGSSLVVWEET